MEWHLEVNEECGKLDDNSMDRQLALCSCLFFFDELLYTILSNRLDEAVETEKESGIIEGYTT